MANPKVSVVTITYNQERYVEQAVQSVIAQQKNFDVEHLIADDCSTDSTGAILQRLAKEHPVALTLNRRQENVGVMKNFCDAYHGARGDYIAFVEGDDYWIDELKLQKQVELMDSHLDCSLCFHPTLYVDERGMPNGTIHPRVFKADWTLGEIVASNPVQTCSMMVRRSAVPSLPKFFLDLKLGDWPLCILAARSGRVLCQSDTMAAYRVHSKGVWSGLAIAKRYSASASMYFRLGIEYPDLRDEMENSLAIQTEALALESLKGHQLRTTRTWRLASAIAWPLVTFRSVFASPQRSEKQGQDA